MKIAIGCDPNAEEEKEELIQYIKRKAMEKLQILEVRILFMRIRLLKLQKRWPPENLIEGFCSVEQVWGYRLLQIR